MAALAPAEILALARISEELDYYQLLHLQDDANARQIKDAYYETSRTFHPDACRHLPDDVRRAVAVIAKRISEAYSILRDPRRRPAYDRHLESGGGARMQLAQAEGAQRAEVEGKTPQGRQYFTLANQDIRRGDFAAAARNLQTALTFEPGNEGFEKLLVKVREKLEHSSA